MGCLFLPQDVFSGQVLVMVQVLWEGGSLGEDMPGVVVGGRGLDVVLSLVFSNHLLVPFRNTVELICFLGRVVEHHPSQVSELLDLFRPVVLIGVLNDDVLVLLGLVAVREHGGYLRLGITAPEDVVITLIPG